MGGDGALYGVLLAAHVICAVLGFGSILVTGCYAGLARPGGGEVPQAARRYFRPGPNVASFLIFAVPVLGVALAGVEGWGPLGDPWLWLGAGLWTVAAVGSALVVWPAEARIQTLVGTRPAAHRAPTVAVAAASSAGGDRPCLDPVAVADLAGARHRAAVGAAVVDLAAAAAFAIMVARPGG